VGGNGLILHGDGTTFQKVESGTDAFLLAVWGFSATTLIIAGDRGTSPPLGTAHDGRRRCFLRISADLWGIWGANTATSSSWETTA
jgi:hypothetical protein